MLNLKSQELTQLLVIVGCAVLLLFLVKTYYYDNNDSVEPEMTPGSSEMEEGFYDYDESSPVEDHEAQEHQDQTNPEASEPMGLNETSRNVGDDGDVSNLGKYMPQECYPKDVLKSGDLLPQGDSRWRQVVPDGQGALTDQNFLTAGHHLGMNTVGSTLRNASHDLRSEVPNPQVQVSPWQQTTIGPDMMRRPLE